MARRGPSLTALLGLLAVAGYQNRDKLSELVKKVQAPDANPRISTSFGNQIKDMLGSSPLGSTLSSTVSELVGMFNGTPQEQPANSWVASGKNAPVQPTELAEVIGDETLQDLVEKTGMSREELLAALSKKIPTAVDAMTPHGRLPRGDEAGAYI